jgi:acetyl-CoA acyltransferase
MPSRSAVIVDAVRTPVGKRRGSLADAHAVSLSARVLAALEQRNGLDPTHVDDVIWGCVHQVGQQALNVGRMAVLAAGWPEAVPGTTVDRQCGSSQQSIHFAAAGIVAGQYDVAVAGGVEIMSAVPIGATTSSDEFGLAGGPEISARYSAEFNQGIAAEMIAEKWHLDRARLDEFASSSHERLAAATDAGAFEAEIAPVVVSDGSKLDADEGLRRGTSPESLSKLKPAFRPDGVIHAGNASQVSDGAAAVLLMSEERAVELGMRPLARIHTAVVAGDDPVMMLTAPIPATAKALARSGLDLDDIGVYEVNEAFAPIPLAWLAETGADPARLNPRGGAIAIGHPLGASGARIMTTLVHTMRAEGHRYGLQTMCEGGGMANCTIVELLD